MNCPTNFNSTSFSKPNVSELVHFAPEAVTVTKQLHAYLKAKEYTFRSSVKIIHSSPCMRFFA